MAAQQQHQQEQSLNGATTKATATTALLNDGIGTNNVGSNALNANLTPASSVAANHTNTAIGSDICFITTDGRRENNGSNTGIYFALQLILIKRKNRWWKGYRYLSYYIVSVNKI
ncbi:uncharacterized protein LOC110118928 isoform X1 [Ceratitis capitata]|uniref:uncharacterized protein LOC110118928 isoform X1 n=1 Tax=Ceratitis capitata TaxID=7213 RepID=UPI000A11E950|nr:uncharacterized protein LOC110118928 isoform X1 [Ceratitis capitata]